MEDPTISKFDIDNPVGLEQIDRAKMLSDIEEDQNLNEIIANLPTEFAVDGKILKVDCKTIKHLVLVDRAILAIQRLAFSTIETESDTIEFWDEVQKKNEKCYELMAKVIFLIVNKNSDNPEITLDWINEHVDVTGGGVGEQIIDSYNYRNSPNSFLKKILGSRKF